MIECVLEGKKPLVGGEDGRRQIEVMIAAELSIAEDRIVSLPLQAVFIAKALNYEIAQWPLGDFLRAFAEKNKSVY